MKKGFLWLTAVGLGLLAILWGIRIFTQPLDEDEIQLMHLVWLVSKGITPYTDCLAQRPPFLTYLFSFISPLFPESPWSIVLWRIVSAGGLIGFIVFYLKNIRLSFSSVPLNKIIPLILIFLFHPSILMVFSQFRIDGWSYALLFGALLISRKNRIKNIFFRYFLCGLLSGISIFLSPKFVFFPVIYTFTETLFAKKRRLDPFKVGGGMILGGLASGLLALNALLLMKINLADFFDYVVLFNWRLNKIFEPQHGLFFGVIREPLLALTVLLGIVCWGWAVHQGKIKAASYEVALIYFMVVQFLFVSSDYSQYVIPLIFLGLHFLPSIFFLNLKKNLRGKHVSFVIIAVLISASALYSFQNRDSKLNFKSQMQFISMMNEIIPPQATVVAVPLLHPIFRKDATFAWYEARDRKGSLIQEIMAHFPDRKDKFKKEYLLKEMAAHPPHLILLGGVDIPVYRDPEKIRAIKQYIDENRAAYLKKEVLGIEFMIRVSDRIQKL